MWAYCVRSVEKGGGMCVRVGSYMGVCGVGGEDAMVNGSGEFDKVFGRNSEVQEHASKEVIRCQNVLISIPGISPCWPKSLRLRCVTNAVKQYQHTLKSGLMHYIQSSQLTT